MRAWRMVVGVVVVMVGVGAWLTSRTSAGPSSADMRRGPVCIRVIGPDGRAVAEARLEGDGSLQVVVGEIAGRQVADVLHLPVGDVPGVPRFDRAGFLDAVARLPGARRTPRRLEADLGAGATLVVEAG